MCTLSASLTPALLLLTLTPCLSHRVWPCLPVNVRLCVPVFIPIRSPRSFCAQFSSKTSSICNAIVQISAAWLSLAIGKPLATWRDKISVNKVFNEVLGSLEIYQRISHKCFTIFNDLQYNSPLWFPLCKRRRLWVIYQTLCRLRWEAVPPSLVRLSWHTQQIPQCHWNISWLKRKIPERQFLRSVTALRQHWNHHNLSILLLFKKASASASDVSLNIVSFITSKMCSYWRSFWRISQRQWFNTQPESCNHSIFHWKYFRKLGDPELVSVTLVASLNIASVKDNSWGYVVEWRF